MLHRLITSRILAPLVAFVAVMVPQAVFATSLVPCGRGNNPGGEGVYAPCTLCHFVVGFDNIFDFLVGILAITAIVILVIAGVIYILSAGSQNMISLAKTAIKNALFGLIIVLAAWVIITFIFTVLARDGGDLQDATGRFYRTQGTWDFACSTANTIGDFDPSELTETPSYDRPADATNPLAGSPYENDTSLYCVPGAFGGVNNSQTSTTCGGGARLAGPNGSIDLRQISEQACGSGRVACLIETDADPGEACGNDGGGACQACETNLVGIPTCEGDWDAFGGRSCGDGHYCIRSGS